MSEIQLDKAPLVLIAVAGEKLRRAIESSLEVGLPAARLGVAVSHLELREWLRGGEVAVLLLEPAAMGVEPRDLDEASDGGPGLPGTHTILVGDRSRRPDLLAALGRSGGDCLFTPFGADELVARVQAGLLRVGTLRRLVRRAVRSEELYSLQTEFLSTVSHEIRTPLSAIMSAANVLVRYGSRRPESVERFARVIHDEGQRLTRLINNLLDLAKIEAGEVDWDFVASDVEELVGSVRRTLANLARESGVTIEVGAVGPLPRIVLDADRIVQVLVNLVSNAIKYAPEGTTVAVRVMPGVGSGVRIEVEDEGPGVPTGMEEKIFERFQQLDVDDARRGTGLGLAISREIVQRHGGSVAAVPARGRGALFVVELPPAPEEVD